MDGTLLDLSYDNDFWGCRIHERYAAIHGCSVEESINQFEPLFDSVSGTLDWYCTDHWSRQFGFSIIELSHRYADGVRWRFDALEFLKRLQRSQVSSVMVTNAHPDIIAMKDSRTGIKRYFDTIVSSHDYGVCKEGRGFWQDLEAQMGFDRQRTLFIDDSPAVIKSAIDYGITHTLNVTQPDTGRPAFTALATASISQFAPIMAGLPELGSD